VIIFDLIRFLYIKKVTKPNFFLKNKNRLKLAGFGSVRFFEHDFGLVFLVGLGFFRFEFGLVFSVSDL